MSDDWKRPLCARSLLGMTLVLSLGAASAYTVPIHFWDSPRKGANGSGADATDSWFRAASAARIEFVRLSVANMDSMNRDFLIGNADKWTAIPADDMQQLRTVLDRADQDDIKVVITMFSRPGCRWRQLNDNRFDYRLWNDEEYQRQSAAFCVAFARRWPFGHARCVRLGIRQP